jgi:hypothetical protein
MSLQIFKRPITTEGLFNLLDTIGTKKDNFYIISNDVYKRGLLLGEIAAFFEKCRPHYFLSKQKYLDKKLTYRSFLTVVRQICNYNKTKYTSQIMYDKSQYQIVYYIYF